DRSRAPARLDQLTGATADPTMLYVYAAYAPYASADWTDYVVTAEISRLDRAGNNGNLFVRINGTSPLVVRTSCCEVQLVDPGSSQLLVSRKIAYDTRHLVAVSVSDAETVVVVDGDVTLRIANPGGPSTTGGFAI